MCELDCCGVLRLTMADIRGGVSFEAATVADVICRDALWFARCVCLTSAEGERRIIGGRADVLRFATLPQADARAVMTLDQIVEELNAADENNVQYIATGDRSITYEMPMGQKWSQVTQDQASHRARAGKKKHGCGCSGMKMKDR